VEIGQAPTQQEQRLMRRWVLAGVTAAVGTSLVLYLLLTIQSAGDSGFGKLPFNDVVKGAIQLRLETSRSMFQVTIVVFGALWGLIITKEGVRHSFTDSQPEFLLFTIANACLLFSAYGHLRYSMRLAEVQADAGTLAEKRKALEAAERPVEENRARDAPAREPVPDIPDIFAPRINRILDLQMWLFGVGCVFVLLTFVSANFLKEAST
jgi:hypothetical protein